MVQEAYPTEATPSPVMAVTVKMRSGALDGTGRSIEEVLLELNDAVATGELGSLRMPAGQNVFDTLVPSCPAGTYQNPTQGCIPCNPGSAPNLAKDGCDGCEIYAVSPNASSWASFDGRSCMLCPAGKEPDGGRAACVGCPAGTAADGLGQLCQACADRSMTPIMPNGTGCECPQDTLDMTRAISRADLSKIPPLSPDPRCPFCAPGFEPNPAGTGCSPCPEGSAAPGPGGFCGACEAGAVPSDDGKFCLPCGALTTPNGDGDTCVPAALAMAGIILLFTVAGGAGGAGLVVRAAKKKRREMMYALEAGYVDKAPDTLDIKAEKRSMVDLLKKAAAKAAMTAMLQVRKAPALVGTPDSCLLAYCAIGLQTCCVLTSTDRFVCSRSRQSRPGPSGCCRPRRQRKRRRRARLGSRRPSLRVGSTRLRSRSTRPRSRRRPRLGCRCLVMPRCPPYNPPALLPSPISCSQLHRVAPPPPPPPIDPITGLPLEPPRKAPEPEPEPELEPVVDETHREISTMTTPRLVIYGGQGYKATRSAEEDPGWKRWLEKYIDPALSADDFIEAATVEHPHQKQHLDGPPPFTPPDHPHAATGGSRAQSPEREQERREEQSGGSPLADLHFTDAHIHFPIPHRPGTVLVDGVEHGEEFEFGNRFTAMPFSPPHCWGLRTTSKQENATNHHCRLQPAIAVSVAAERGGLQSVKSNQDDRRVQQPTRPAPARTGRLREPPRLCTVEVRGGLGGAGGRDRAALPAQGKDSGPRPGGDEVAAGEGRPPRRAAAPAVGLYRHCPPPAVRQRRDSGLHLR